MAKDLDDIYDDDYLEEAVEDDEIDELEEGFMEGYKKEDSELCALCKHVLVSAEETIELEIKDQIYKFCSEYCAEKFKKKHKL